MVIGQTNALPACMPHDNGEHGMCMESVDVCLRAAISPLARPMISFFLVISADMAVMTSWYWAFLCASMLTRRVK